MQYVDVELCTMQKNIHIHRTKVIMVFYIICTQ